MKNKAGFYNNVEYLSNGTHFEDQLLLNHTYSYNCMSFIISACCENKYYFIVTTKRVIVSCVCV